MPYVHEQEREEHGSRIEGIDKELVMIDVDVHLRALRGGEFDDSENNSVLRRFSNGVTVDLRGQLDSLKRNIL